MNVALVYPERPAWPKMRWVKDAIDSLGHRTRHVNTQGRNATAILEDVAAADAECDLILFCQKGFGLSAADLCDLAEERRALWGQWWFDLLAVDHTLPLCEQSCLREKDGGGQYQDADMLRLMRMMDLVFVKERSLVRDYHALGVNARWLDQACPSWLGACEHASPPEFDVLVFGSRGMAWRQRRRDAGDLVREGFTVAWAGHPDGDVPPGCQPLPFCPPEKLPELASRAAVVLCVDARHDVEGYWSDRLWLATGMGACVVRRFTPGLPGGVVAHTRLTSESAGLFYSVRRLCGSPGLRRSLGTAARRYVMANHTYEHRVQELLEQCSNLKRESAVCAAAPAR